MFQKIHHAIYFALFGLLAVSLIFLASHLSKSSWEWYGKIYLVLLIISTWYFFILLFIGELKKGKRRYYKNQLIWVVMPVFNESMDLLTKAIKSLVDAKGNKKILVINDGSTNGTKEGLDKLANLWGFEVAHFQKNQGKRHAIHYATKRVAAHKSLYGDDQEFVVTVDSDTILDKNALVRVIAPLQDKKIAASTGDVLLLNEQENWLTKMTGAYYWIGLNIYKKAQSSLGMVVCCSGCLSAYRRDVLTKIVDEFVNQRFLNESCTHSEDRHLTNLVLKRGFKVVFVPDAISYTNTPNTIKGFLKQQQRWKRGFIRESTYTLAFAWKTNRLLFFELLFWDLTVPFYEFGLRIATIITAIANPMFFLTTIIPLWIYVMFIRHIFIVFQARKKIMGMFYYVFFYELFLYWQNVYALFTVKNKSWITR